MLFRTASSSRFFRSRYQLELVSCLPRISCRPKVGWNISSQIHDCSYTRKCLRHSLATPSVYRHHSQASRLLYSRPQTHISHEQPTLFNYIPKQLVPYAQLMRIDKPAGTWLLYLPCVWSISMASFKLLSQSAIPLSTAASGITAVEPFLILGQTVWYLGLFGVGAFIMRGAGCTINDLWDRDFDKRVERTRSRPLASGSLSYFQAITFLGLQLAAGLAVLTQLNLYSILLGASSLALVVTYPLMKRITYWPQAVLGLTFNWGALLGSSAVLGVVDWSVSLPLYLAGVCWTLVYDTIYALQDKSDDLKVGIKSTAINFGNHIKPILSGFATLSVICLGLSGYMNGHSWIYYGLSVGGAAIHYFWQLKALKVDNVVDAGKKFSANRNLGFLVTGGIILDWVYLFCFGR